MAIYKWIATTNNNFSNSSAWSGGVVPSSGDSIVFDNSGTGRCTLDMAIEVLDLRILTTYTGQFLQNGKKITLGNNGSGQLHIEGPATFNGVVDFYGNDIIVNSSIGSSGTLNIFTNAEYRQGDVSIWKIHLQNGIKLRFPSTAHPQTGVVPHSVLYANGIENNGTIESAVSFNCTYFRQNGLLTNSTSTERFLYPGSMSVGSSHQEQGIWTIMSISSRNTTFSPGNYLGFGKISSAVDTPMSFLEGEFDLPLFQPNGNVITSSQTFLSCHADVTFRNSPTSFQATVFLKGTADQELNIPSSYNLVSENGVGKIRFLSGGIQLLDESVFGSLDIPANSSAVFSQNAKNITVGQNGVGKLWAMKPSTFDGTVDFHGDDIAINAAIGNQGILNIHANTIYRQGDLAAWKVVIDEDVTFLQPYSPHPDLNFIPYTQMYSAGIENNGTVNSGVGYTGTAFTNNGSWNYIGSVERYIAAAQFSVGPNHSVSGLIAIRGLASRKPTFSPGDYRGFTRIYSNPADNATFTFSNGEFDLPAFCPSGNVTASNQVLLRCHSDVIFATVPTSSFQATILCTADGNQTIDIQRKDQSTFLEIDNNQGTPRLIGEYKLARNSRSYAFPVLETGSSLQLNGFQLQITGHELFLGKSVQGKICLDGELMFYSGELVMTSFQWHDSSKITIAGTCDARFVSTTGEYDLPDIEVSETGCLRLLFSQHRYVDGNVASVLNVHGNADIYGTLEIPEAGCCRFNMTGVTGRFSAGKLVTQSNAEMWIDPGTTEVAPENLRIDGNVAFQWNADEAVPKLAPGDYRAVSLLEFGENIAAVSFQPGEYRFSSVLMTTGDAKTIALLDTSEEGGIHWTGKITICGKGSSETSIINAHFESLSLDCPFVFDTDAVRIDNPEILSGGSIKGNRLIAVASSSFTMSDGGFLDVETLHLIDGDGSFRIPEKGYRSLTLEARKSNSLVFFAGIYQMENLCLVANGQILTVDVCRSPEIAISENITSEIFDRGTIRIQGNGTDQWIFNGTDAQTIQLEPEHGYHVLNRLIDAKSSGDIELSNPLTVFDFRDQYGNHLAPLDGMTILSDITLSTRLMLTREGSGEFYAQDGVELESISISPGEIVNFYAKLATEEDEAIAVDWVESVTLDYRMMNPIAPSLHKARTDIVRNMLFPVETVMSNQWESQSLPEGETCNFSLSNRNVSELTFSEPGLYYVVIGIKLFGHAQAFPMRYVFHCDR